MRIKLAVKRCYESFPCLPTSLSLCVYLWCCKRQGANKLLNKLAARMDRASLVEVQDRNMVVTSFFKRVIPVGVIEGAYKSAEL